MIAPCRCTGSSRYIHRECLDRYLAYYPDRICRVCRSEMTGSADTIRMYIVLLGLGITLAGSAVPIAAKVILSLTLFALTVVFARNKLFSQTLAIGALVVYVSFVSGGHPQAIATMLTTLVLVGTLVTMFMYVPSMYVATVAVILLVFTYLLMMVLAFATLVDSYALAVFVSLLYMGWYAWIRIHPPMRLLVE